MHLFIRCKYVTIHQIYNSLNFWNLSQPERTATALMHTAYSQSRVHFKHFKQPEKALEGRTCISSEKETSLYFLGSLRYNNMTSPVLYQTPNLK